MDWQGYAPWVMVGIAVIGQVAQIAVSHWRIGALDRWRESVDEFIAEFREAKGAADSIHDDHERRIGRLENSQDERNRSR